MNALETALYTRLADALTGVTGIFHSVAPPEQPFPYVVFSLVSGTTDDTCDRDGYRFLYDVKVVSAKAWPKEAGALAEQVSAALHKVTLQVQGWVCVDVRRESRRRFRDPDGRWNDVITFRILLQEG